MVGAKCGFIPRILVHWMQNWARILFMSEKALVWLLRISGVVLLTALVPVVMPFGWMQMIHREIGMGELPTGPIVGYLTRSLSLMYAVHGAYLIFVSLDIRRYLPFVRFLATVSIVFGVSMMVLDYAVKMPLYWTLSEGPMVVVLSIVMLWLVSRCLDR
jgi:hypothetical protein